MTFYVVIFCIAAISIAVAVLMHWPKLADDSKTNRPTSQRRK